MNQPPLDVNASANSSLSSSRLFASRRCSIALATARSIADATFPSLVSSQPLRSTYRMDFPNSAKSTVATLA